MIPAKLKEGDEIRVVAPSNSLSTISPENRKIAIERLNQLGLKVTFSRNAEELDIFKSSSIKSRVEDLHEAFSDNNVKAVFAVIGGFNCNQLLRYIDYEIIRKNPKIFCGYSDTTALQNVFYSKTGLVTYSGPSFSSFAKIKDFDYILENFRRCLFSNGPFEIKPSEEWSNDKWYKNQEKRKLYKNKGYLVINEGEANGTIVGGNLCTLNLLQGTEFMPSLNDSVLFLEDDYESKAVNFDRDLQSLIHQPGFEGVKGLVIGRFERKSKVTNKQIIKIVKTKRELENIPVIANVDFGHTTPFITFPIGGKVSITGQKSSARIEILEH